MNYLFWKIKYYNFVFCKIKYFTYIDRVNEVLEQGYWSGLTGKGLFDSIL